MFSVGASMRLSKPGPQSVLLLSSFFLMFCSSALAQRETEPAARPAAPVQKKLPAAKQQAPVVNSPDPDEEPSTGDASGNRDSAEAIRKREEWFYKQRSSANGHIPAGARFKAFQHMQRMMISEGKLVQRPDGSYAEAAAQSWLSPFGAVTSPWAPIGPTPTTGGFFSPVTGRVMTIAVDPSDTTGNTVLLGGAMGGIWRSTDAGATWTAVGDQNASLAMGSIAFATSSSACSPSPGSCTVYAGTGEQTLAFDTYYGAGVLKSTNHGQTWTQTCTAASATCPFIGPFTDGANFGGSGFGFLNFGGAHISYIAVNPSNPNMVLAGVQFIVEGPKEGVYCSDNGGTTWSNILPDEMASFVGFASSGVAYAAFGNLFGSAPGAPNGNGIYKATGIGSTCASIHFTRLTAATLPAQSTMGRIDLGIAPSDTTGNTVYASIADARTASSNNLGVFLTTNGGTSWTQTSAPDVCRFQCWYDNVVKVDPNNKNIAFFGGGAVRDSSGNFSWVVRTTNSGGTWSSVIPNLPSGSAGLPHVDNHAMAFFKATSGTFSGKVRMYLGNDGGIWRTDDAEAATITWTNLNNASLTLTQFYPSISIHATEPSISFGGTQDNGSQNYQGGTSWMDNQLCGDGASSATDAVTPSTVYIGCATGAPVNASYQNGAIGTFSPAFNGINVADIANFITPLVTDPNLPNVVYFAADTVYESVDAGITWAPISGSIGNPSYAVITSLAIGSSNSSVLYAGLSNGTVEVETNANSGMFANFSPVSGQSALPPRSVTAIAVDGADTSGKTLYVAYSGFSLVGSDPFGNPINDPLGHVFKTIDGGNTWTDVSCSSTTNCSSPAATDLPNIPVNDVVVDPDIPGTLYAATDLGVFIGNCSAMPCTWSTLSTGLPRAAVLSLRLHEPSRTLRAATHGRGAWDINLNNFAFSGPHVSSLSPVSVNVNAASFTLTVNGSGLTGGAIHWNGSATGVTMLSGGTDTKLTATIATSLLTVAGTPKITVVNGSQTSNALTFAILAGTPTITSITPSSAPVQTTPSTNVAITLTGTNFSSSAKVLFNGAQNGITIAAPTAGCPLPTCLKATLPAALLGPFGSTDDIAVLNFPPGGGQSQPQTFKVVAPAPPNDNFANAINITTLSFNDLQDSSGATTETADPTPPCAQQFTPAQGNTGGHSNGAYNTIWYKFTPFFSANLDVDTFVSNYDTVLSIWTGTQGSLTNVACNDDSTSPTPLQSQLQNVPLAVGTTYYIMVSSFGPPDPNPIALGGRSRLGFQYNNGSNPAPTITSVSPISANSGDPSFTLTVNGNGFLNGAYLALQEQNPPYPTTTLTTTFISSTQVTAVVPTSAILFPGSYLILAFNPSPALGPTSFPFTVNVGVYPVPTLNSVSPNSVVAGTPSGITLDIWGTQFAQNAVVNFNGIALVTDVTGHAHIQATVSASAIVSAGTVQVTVSNPPPGGGPSNPLPFAIAVPTQVPTITSIAPNSIPVNTPSPITVTGTGFLQGANIYIGNIGYPGANTISQTQIAVNPNLMIGVPGTYQLYVVDPPPAGTSAPVNLTVVGPPDFSIASSGTTTQTVSAGSTATFTNVITVSPMNGFTAQVSLTCSLPITAKQTTCSVNPNSFPNGSGTASVTVTTTARGLMPPFVPIGRFRWQPRWLLPFFVSMLLAILLLRLARTRRQRLVGALPLAVLVLFVLLQAMGCGGGGGYTPPPPPTGTPAGTYTVTVTGTSGSSTHTTTLTLVVN